MDREIPATLDQRSMNPTALIEKYYSPGSFAHRILTIHSEQVTRKALELAERVKHLQPDVPFIREAAMLHDIGMIFTHAPDIGCYGDKPYIQHGILGRELLEKEGYPRHALVCERHTGVGITRADIARFRLPLPDRDLVPVTLEEKIICFADKFFSKDPQKLEEEKSIEEIKEKLSRFGEDKVRTIEEWVRFFGL